MIYHTCCVGIGLCCAVLLYVDGTKPTKVDARVDTCVADAWGVTQGTARDYCGLQQRGEVPSHLSEEAAV